MSHIASIVSVRMCQVWSPIPLPLPFEWLGGVVFRSSDSWLRGEIDSWLPHCQVVILGKLFTPMCLCRCKWSSSRVLDFSLTVHICMIFECIMRDNIIYHLKKYKLIKESQHGFVKNKSCLSNLLVFMEEITSYADSGYPADIICLDFQKAFDKVPYCRLLMKLWAHGINGRKDRKWIEWIESRLTGRKQSVLHGQLSGWRYIEWSTTGISFGHVWNTVPLCGILTLLRT